MPIVAWSRGLPLPYLAPTGNLIMPPIQPCRLCVFLPASLGLAILFSTLSLVADDAACGQAATGQAATEQANEIIQQTGVSGGLIVELGCTDGRLAAALARHDAMLVHGLALEPKFVETARTTIDATGLYGRASVQLFSGSSLPYADNLVRLLIVSDFGEVTKEDCLRALAPGGVLCVKDNKGWSVSKKPWPAEIDEWTHYLHGASGNAVADDTAVGPPRHLRWVSGPPYCRSHEIDSSVSALVTAAGRMYYILDEGLIGITDPRLPPRWVLLARDAFSGVALWKRPMPEWGWRQWKPEWGEQDWTGTRGHRLRIPATLSRRLVVQDDRVFATLGYDAPVSVLDAASGQTLHTLDGTKGTDEILACGGRLVLHLHAFDNDQRRRTGNTPVETICLVDPAQNRILWRYKTPRIVPLTLASDGKRVVFFDTKDLVGLDFATGEEIWRSSTLDDKKRPVRRSHTLVISDGVVLLLGSDRLLAVSADNGKLLWEAPGSKGPGAGNPPDLFVADGLVWYGCNQGGYLRDGVDVKRIGYDLHSGQPRRSVEVDRLISPGHHFRCYRSKATERYLLWPKRGVEFIDLEGDNHMRHDWLRAPCKLGCMPANGLLYVPPHQCFCYAGAKLRGFNALAAANRDADNAAPESVGPSSRLVKGPAYDRVNGEAAQSAAASPPLASSPDDWPTLRHDPRRTGATTTQVPTSVVRRWRASPGGKLTQPVVVGDRLYVAEIDEHRLLCLEAAEGQTHWHFIAEGRIDSPPTVHRGLVLFGSADGSVYCLTADDGALVWRFRAAPRMRRIVSYDQLESPWPVHGSVLVQNELVYFAAGRSSYLDGGIKLFALEPQTGKVVHQTRVEGPYPNLSQDVGRPFDMDGTVADVLVSEGKKLFMQQTAFDAKLNQLPTPRITEMGDRQMGRHVLATAGLLDGTSWNRTFWMYGSRWPGFYIANQAPKSGQLLVVDKATTYAVKYFTRRNRHSPMFFPGKQGYLVFADDNNNEPVLVDESGKPELVRWLPELNPAIGHKLTDQALNRDKGTGFARAKPAKWTQWVPIRVRAMVRTPDALFIAGPPDVLDSSDPLASFEGRRGGLLWAVSPENGSQLGAWKLDAPPVFDGLIAAHGKLFLAATDGSVVCLAAP